MSIGRQFATGMLVAHDSCFYIKPGNYQPAFAPVTCAYMLHVGSINIFIGLTDTIENFDDSAQNMRMTPLLTQVEYDQARLATLPLSGGGSIEGAINSAVESNALADDADSADPPSDDGSIIAASFDGSITRAPSDWCRGDLSKPLSYSES
jgi:hypothetical protein